MGREQRRAEKREEAKRERLAERSAREPTGDVSRTKAPELPETRDQTARRIYRMGGKTKRRSRTKRSLAEKPVKWRQKGQ